MGQFNKASIRISFIGLVYPSLLLAYMGQGAQLIVRGEEVISNVFFQTIPGPANGGLFWIVWLFSILATVSAALIILPCF